MSFRNCGDLRKMSPAQEKPRRNTGQRRGVILPGSEPPAAQARHRVGLSLTLKRRAGTGVKRFI